MKKNDINLIEKYIDGELNGEALILFEHRLKTDKPLINAYNQRIKFAKLWVDAADYSATKAQIGKILHKQKKSHSGRFYILSIAASIIVLFGVYLFLFQNNNPDHDFLNNQLANVHDSVSNEENPIKFQYNKLDKYAAVDSIYGSIQLLFPVNNEIFYISDSITFKWKSKSNQYDTLFISNESNSENPLKFKLRLTDTTYTLKHTQFNEGNYFWYISERTNHGKFSVIN